MSELSTVAIKDGHRGHLPHQHTQAPSGLSNQLDAERADRISRLAGLERVTTARNPTPIGQLTPGAAVPAQPPQGYFDAQGNPVMGRERSTVGSASATGSDTSSVGGMSEEGTGSLVGFGESGTRTPARQSVISNPGGKSGTPTARDMRMNEGPAYNRDSSDIRPSTGNTGSAAEQAERIMRDNMDTTSNDRMLGGSGQKNDLGKFGFEK
jgi:hypothetical protein